jgi:hypothetical protein
MTSGPPANGQDHKGGTKKNMDGFPPQCRLQQYPVNGQDHNGGGIFEKAYKTQQHLKSNNTLEMSKESVESPNPIANFYCP